MNHLIYLENLFSCLCLIASLFHLSLTRDEFDVKLQAYKYCPSDKQDLRINQQTEYFLQSTVCKKLDYINCTIVTIILNCSCDHPIEEGTCADNATIPKIGIPEKFGAVTLRNGDLMEDPCPSGKSPRSEHLAVERCSLDTTSFGNFTRTEGLHSIRELYIRHSTLNNTLKPHHFQNLQSVYKLHMSDNIMHGDLPETAFQSMTDLRFLNIENNSIGDLPQGLFRPLQQLQHLSLSYNDLSGIPEKIFYNNRNLTNVNMTKTCISAMSTLPQGLFANLTFLHEVQINANHFTQLPDNLFENCYNLKFLRLDCNALRTLPSVLFKDTSNLLYLNITGNKFDNFTQLVTTFYPLKNLEKLYMANACTTEALPTLPERLFANMGALKYLYMDRNHFTNLPPNLLENCYNLTYLHLSNNDLEKLPSSLFTHTPNLIELKIDANRLVELPPNLLRNCTKLKTITFANNVLKMLPDSIFINTVQLAELDISYNKLEFLNDTIFDSLKELKHLTLAGNYLKFLNSKLFVNLHSLTKLNLSRNHFTGFPDALLCDNLNTLVILDMSHNSAQDIWVAGMPNLETLIFNNNSIGTFDYDNDVKLHSPWKVLDLRANNFTSLTSKDWFFPKPCEHSTTIDFSDNQIEAIILDDSDTAILYGPTPLFIEPPKCSSRDVNDTIFKLTNNPLICDCKIFRAALYMQQKNFSSAHLILQDANCYKPDFLKNTSLDEVDLQQLKCSLNISRPEASEKCPPNCDCHYRPSDEKIIVDCSGKGMQTLPQHIPPINDTDMELLLHNNAIRSLRGLSNLFNNTRVTRLSLSFNKLKNTDHFAIPIGLKVLELDHNELSHLEETTIDQLNSSKTSISVTLNNNPWQCDCETTKFMEFLQYQNLHKKILNYSTITCQDNEKPIVLLLRESLCPPFNSTFIFAISAFIFMTAFITAVAYNIYEYEIKVWMFAHGWFSWLISEEKLDKDKRYDAFVSFNETDRPFVEDHLMKELEPEYKLCVHFREFVVGEYIAAQITRSVYQSRRTIIVLSPNYLTSNWGREEFRTAHTKAIGDYCARVIIILLSDIDTHVLTPELQAYITTRTYLKWGDPWFWKKLK